MLRLRCIAADELKLLEDIYADWGRGDYRRTDFYADEIEFVYTDGFPDPATFRGKDQLWTGWMHWLGQWDDMRVAAGEMIEAGETIIVFVTLHGRAKTSGAELEQPGANRWLFRDGKAVRLEIYPSRDAALRAAGIEPGSA